MKRVEHLLVCLEEECAEVAQAAAKALRFGLTDGYPGGETTNAQDIAAELDDLFAVAGMLRACGALPPGGGPAARVRKEVKVLRFMEYAQGLGTLEEDDG